MGVIYDCEKGWQVFPWGVLAGGGALSTHVFRARVKSTHKINKISNYLFDVIWKKLTIFYLSIIGCPRFLCSTEGVKHTEG